MTITLLPYQEKALEDALKAGVIRSVEEFVDTALAHLADTSGRSAESPERTGQTLIDVFAEIRGVLTDEEVDTLFARNRMQGRAVDLS